MEDLLSVDKLVLFVAFFVPGFVSATVWSLVVATDATDFAKDFPRLIGYSVLHYGATLWLVLLAPAGIPKLIAAYIDVLVLPTLWPFAILMIRDPSRYSAAISKGRIFELISAPQAKPWDRVFEDLLKGGGWVQIKLKTGGFVGGIFGRNGPVRSQVSSHPSDEQIFVAVEYEFDGEGYIVGSGPKDRTAGLLVNGTEIEYVRFYR